MPRPKSFSADDALDVATELFLQRGYTALVMREIAAALGLSRSSIYATWGNKLGLFVVILKRYGPSRAPGLSELCTASAPRAALVRLFEQTTVIERNPCLLINSLVEFKAGDPSPEVGRLLAAAALEMERCLTDAVRRGQEAGEIMKGVDPARRGQVLLALYLGLHVLVRSKIAVGPVLRAVVQQVEAMLPAPRSE